MQKIKILHILYSGQGGLGTYFMNFVQSDKEKRFEHYAFFYGIEPLNKELEDFCITQHIPFEYQGRRSKIDLKAIKAVLNFQKEHQMQYLLLHTFSMSPLTVIGLFKKWQLLAFDHTTLSYKTSIEKVFTLINHLFAYKMIYFYTGHFEQNQRVFPFLKFGKNSHIIPKTVDVNFFKPLESKPKNDFLTLGITARLIQGKRHDLIINSLAKLKKEGKKIRLKIAGTGPKENELKNLVNRLDLNEQVEFTGLLTRNQLLNFYQSLDAYLHASEGETICYSIMEAQACGLPILASDVEGINNFISKSNDGILFHNTVDSLCKTILELLSSDLSELEQASRKNSIYLDNRYNNAKMFKQIIK